MSGEINQTSEAVGRIEAKCDMILEQNKTLFRKIDEIHKDGCMAGRETCAGNKRSAVVWGSGAGAIIAGILEAIRLTFNAK